ncbi:MAG: rRNA maturation RNase YbeY [Gemmatimonadetes bacterium]|nr:rRNA maturation RNase YbeY [Gemmatimonadota bacterium]
MTEALQVDVHVEDVSSLSLDTRAVEDALRRVLAAEGIGAAEISVTFVNDARIAELNREYLHHDGPTDVISFPLHVTDRAPLGDVYVGAEQAARQAAELGVPLPEELLRLAIHGTLHVLGYDHPEEAAEREASPMYHRQEALLSTVLSGQALPPLPPRSELR